MTCKSREELIKEVKALSIENKAKLYDFLVALKAEEEAEKSKEAKG